MKPERRQSRRQDRHFEDPRAPAAQGRDPLHHLAVGHHLGPARIEAFSERSLVAAYTGEIAADVVECDRLGGVDTQLGVIIAGRRSTRATIVSNAALPSPTIIAARSVVTGTAPAEGVPPSLAGSADAATLSGRRRRAHPDRRSASPQRARMRSPQSPPLLDPAARSRAYRESGRGSRRPVRHRRLARHRRRNRRRPRSNGRHGPLHAWSARRRRSSWPDTRRGRSARPTTPVAPKTVTFTGRPSRRAARSSGG